MDMMRFELHTSGNPVPWDCEPGLGGGGAHTELFSMVHVRHTDYVHWGVRIDRSTHRITHVTAGASLFQHACRQSLLQPRQLTMPPAQCASAGLIFRRNVACQNILILLCTCGASYRHLHVACLASSRPRCKLSRCSHARHWGMDTAAYQHLFFCHHHSHKVPEEFQEIVNDLEQSASHGDNLLRPGYMPRPNNQEHRLAKRGLH